MTTRSKEFKIRAMQLIVAATASLALAACGGGFGDNGSQGEASADSGGPLSVMIGSSGEAETGAVQEATKRYTDKTGTQVKVIPAQDLVQQLQQGFAGGHPPDLFYVSPDRVQLYVKGGSLYPYGDQVSDADDFYQSLRQPFTIDNKLYCIPKDGGSVALVINTDMWKQAGLTDADIPKTWDDLARVGKALTTKDHAGLVLDWTDGDVGTFMLQAGGFFVNEDQTQVTADTPQNLEALNFLMKGVKDGWIRTVKDVESEWSGEAIGTGKAAMVIQGGWIVGAFNADYPDIKWKAVDLPTGPAGQGSMVFTNCWGIAQDSQNMKAAVELVKQLVSPEEQKASLKAFGSNPSRQSLAAYTADQVPEQKAFSSGLSYGRAQVGIPGFDSVLGDFNSQLEAMKRGSVTPEQVLQRLQKNGEAALADQ